MSVVIDYINKLRDTTPIFRKWGRGRPTKEMKAEREAYQKWFADNSHFLKSLLSDNEHKPIIKDGKIFIKYLPKTNRNGLR